MFPVDPRLGTDFFRGARQFISKIPCSVLIPMHFGKDYAEIKPFEDIAKLVGCRYIPLKSSRESEKLVSLLIN